MEHIGICTHCYSVFSKKEIGKICPICKEGKIISSSEVPEEDTEKFLHPYYKEMRIKEKIGTQVAFFYIGLFLFFALETFIIWFLLNLVSPSFQSLSDNNIYLSFLVSFSPILLLIIVYKILSKNPDYPTLENLKEQNKKLGAVSLFSLSVLVGTLFILVLSGLLIDFDNYYALAIDKNKVPFAIFFVIISGLIVYFKVFRFNGLKYLEKIGAKPLDKDLYITDEVHTLALGIGLSDLYVYEFPEDAPNAFAIDDGRHKIVGLSTGLINWWNLSNAKKIKRDERITLPELHGIIAHELGHLKNKDARIMSYISALTSIAGLSITIIVILLTLAIIFGSKKERGSGRAIDAIIRGGIGLYIASLVFSMAFFRQREYLADLTGGALISNPAALASALSKLRAYKPKTEKKVVVRAMYQIDPEGFDRPKKTSLSERLFSTHPPIEERIKRLRAAAHEDKL